jgi:NAD-dependent SIR2 family protein deacetylase
MTDSHLDQKIKQLIDQAEGVVILAGAGMSVDSGLPDFRGTTGLWTQAKEDFITLASGIQPRSCQGVELL